MDTESLIAQNVRARMEAKGLGPKALSLAAGLNETYVRDLLKGRSRNPRQAHLQRLAIALDCRASDLTGETEPVDATLTDETRRQLLAAFESADQQGREMLLRLAQSLRRDEPPAKPQPNPRRPAACIVPAPQRRARQ